MSAFVITYINNLFTIHEMLKVAIDKEPVDDFYIQL